MAKRASLTMSGGDWALLVVLSVFWGGTFYFAKVALGSFPPVTLAFCRVAIAAAILGLICKALARPFPKSAPAWRPFFVMGLLNNVVPFCLLFWGQTHIASGLASILNATTPLFTVVFAHYATDDDRLDGGRAAGLLIGFAGVVIMLGPDLLGTLGTDLLAQLACLGAAVCYAISGIYGRRFRKEAPLTIAASQMTASSVMLLPLSLLIDRPWTLSTPTLPATAALLALAAISTALSYLIFFRILARAGATNILLVTFLIPPSAILLGIFLLGERLEPRQFAGMAAIALGLAAIDGRPLRALSRAAGAK